MSLSDPISDMLTRIRNGIMASYDTVDIPSSRLKINIAKILKAEGFIKNYKIIPDRQHGIIRIFLKYDEKGAPLIGGLKRVSKPSGRVYTKKDRIPIVLERTRDDDPFHAQRGHDRQAGQEDGSGRRDPLLRLVNGAEN